jgi:ATP/maltotriose-dependent transcriptional regulator MalT
MGEFDEALRLARDAVDSAEGVETPWMFVQYCLVLGDVAALAGDFDQAVSLSGAA